jgi:heme exporter protein D
MLNIMRAGHYYRRAFRINTITIVVIVFNTVGRHSVSLQGYKQRKRRDSVTIYVLE